MKLTTIQRKKFRVSNKVKRVSNANRLRLSLNRSSKNISAQIIDDSKKITVVSSTSNTKSIKSLKKNKSEISIIVAENLADKALEKKINKIYFDRGIYKYHGRIKIFADTLRKKGLEF
tara:strand:+ start:259 stop:612 length:354 start_codon:yes stop_codon:yes gene_type:complete